jgi:beta-exotoxin I transport system permease protein
MLASVFAKSLRDVRRALVWWSLGLVGLVALTVAVYPSIRDNPSLNRTLRELPESVKSLFSFSGQFDLTSPAGYLGSRLFSFMVPLLLLVAAIGAGARAIAGEEERGTLDLLLASPISRRRVALEKLGALAAEVVALGLVLWLALLVATSAVDMKIGAGDLAAATAAAVLLAFGFGAISLLVGCATGRRGVATGAAAALAVAAYLVNSLAAQVSALEPFQKASPFYHYAAHDPLRHGLSGWHMLFLATVAAAATALAPELFDRRDLR